MIQAELGWGPFSAWIFELGWGPFSNSKLETIDEIHIYGAKMFIKRDRFLGKFKKDPPHIGEYDKKWHFGGGECSCSLKQPITRQA